MKITPNKGFILWLMGPTSSGKTTIAEALVPRIKLSGLKTIHIDGDEVRNLFGKDLGFGPEQRNMVVNTIIHFAVKAADVGVNVVVSALTATEEARALVQNRCPNLIIGYICCDIDVCAARDPKGLYARAKTGEINTLIGYNTEYIPPKNPNLIINTNSSSVTKCTQQIESFLNAECIQFKNVSQVSGVKSG